MADTTFSALISATGTPNQIGISGGLNPVYSIIPNPILPGTASFTLPFGTTAQRAAIPRSLRFNTDTNVFESTIDGATYQTFSSATGPIASITGTANRISITPGINPVVDIDAAYIGQNSITTLGTLTTGIWNASLIPLAFGGSNANLTASNGGIVWSNATQMQVLGGTATARQMLQSGATAIPAWSTATWPATTTANQILYSSANNTVSEITVANSATLVTSSAGIPSLAPMTNGQVIIGNTGGTPTAATLTAGNGITITNGAGSLGVATNGVLRSFQILTAGIGATYTKPAGITNILVECIGGGGAGGGAVSTTGITTSAAAGAGGGGYCRKLFSPAAATYNYNIGTAGVPAAAGNNKGGDGGNTIFGTLNAGGGNGGNGCPESASSQISGAPGSGGISTGGDVNIQGQDGNYGFTSLIAYAISGNGGSNILGAGGPQVASTNLGVSGVAANANSGCGGSGGVVANATTSVSGGAGGSGLIIVWEFA